ncbi:MAG TPA: hypothetical protein DD713_09190 [Nitrospiraceae bacterium]|nr:hypothetical protein [Nitrospiraceae bacterium]
MFKNLNLLSHFSSFPIINWRFPGLFGSQGKLNNDKKAEEFLQMLGIGDKVNAYPSHLSGGQQRRVAIVHTPLPHKSLLVFVYRHIYQS